MHFIAVTVAELGTVNDICRCVDKLGSATELLTCWNVFLTAFVKSFGLQYFPYEIASVTVES